MVDGNYINTLIWYGKKYEVMEFILHISVDAFHGKGSYIASSANECFNDLIIFKSKHCFSYGKQYFHNYDSQLHREQY